MPKRTDIHTILVIGAGPIIIGQACEFDYSGTQACKALREEGYRLVLINSNPATMMTDPEIAHATYIEPITPEFVTRVIEKERPDAILASMGGQTALNIAVKLHTSGVLEKHKIELIGVTYDAIEKAENRESFKAAMDRIGLRTPNSAIASAPPIADSEEFDIAAGVIEAMEALEKIGLPAIIRPAFTLGGVGGGIAYNAEDYEALARQGLKSSPTGQILIDESLIGYKEFEMEVVRDKADNAIVVCSIENIDPMGVHTGDSITVAPALTLTDREFQKLRTDSIAVLREIGVETGGSNVQFAINPVNGMTYVIEMNPRVSRSSALASKATGFPIAKVAARLAVGYTLDEIINDVTKTTPASFEPTIDYIVIKIPRFAFEKFPHTKVELTTSMRSVGEAMAIGRSFHESLQKALCSLDIGLTGLDDIVFDAAPSTSDDDSEITEPASADDYNKIICSALARPNPNRILFIAQALREGIAIDTIQHLTEYDQWFIDRIAEIVEEERKIKDTGFPQDRDSLRALKKMGFSDQRLATLSSLSEDEVRKIRLDAGVIPVFKAIDTCAAEFPCVTSYMYSTYESEHDGTVECEASPTKNDKVMILGGGANRIGQGIEFDYCCCHAALALSEAGYETIMVNCNPETVSTDYDTSDRLYFEPLTTEHILNIVAVEEKKARSLGVIVQFGGQTPLKLAKHLQKSGVQIFGTQPESIALAEDRERFKMLLSELEIRQPENGVANTLEEAIHIIDIIGFPAVLRPSNVLGGRGMEIVRDQRELKRYINHALRIPDGTPILIDSYLRGAIEVDVDALCDGTPEQNTYIAGVMQHIEEAGVHSGDSACTLPPYSLDPIVIAAIEDQTVKLAKALAVSGLVNVQYAVKDGEIFVLEANPRASRTIPFVAKTTGIPVAGIAARLMLGESLQAFNIKKQHLSQIAVKEAVFPFSHFPGMDTILGPEMRSTGEVMGIDYEFSLAFLKSQIAAGVILPNVGTVFISVKDSDKENFIALARQMVSIGFSVVATQGTANAFTKTGLKVQKINKNYEGRPSIIDIMKDGRIHLVFNTSEGLQSVKDSHAIRTTALVLKIPYYTTFSGAQAAVMAITDMNKRTLEVTPVQDYNSDRFA
jgi:carbamoyl-phosphate synthase large subunit